MAQRNIKNLKGKEYTIFTTTITLNDNYIDKINSHHFVKFGNKPEIIRKYIEFINNDLKTLKRFNKIYDIK